MELFTVGEESILATELSICDGARQAIADAVFAESRMISRRVHEFAEATRPGSNYLLFTFRGIPSICEASPNSSGVANSLFVPLPLLLG
jgi:hypothetical protein